MSNLAAATIQDDNLPVVDVAALTSDSRADRMRVGSDIRSACLDKGFFYIRGHGIPADMIARMFDEAERFFTLPLAVKAQLDKARSSANRGYEPLGGQRLEEGAPPDLKESLFIGREDAVDSPAVVGGQFGRGPNMWPDLPGFRAVVEGYYARMTDLGHLLYRGIALSLGLDEAFFDDFYAEPVNIIRMIHYPQQPANPLPSQKGCGAHTDFGGITILAQDSAGGLQVWDERQGWIHATPVTDTFVVNLGDFMARWTNGRYRSTLHRVVNTSGRERYSIPFFVNGASDYEVSCIPTCLAPGERPRFPPITVAKHFTSMYARTAVA